MIGIIGALDIEVDSIISAMESRMKNTIFSTCFVSGRLRGQDVVIARCGVGKVNAALCAQSMLLTYKPDAVINTGVAGSLSGEVGLLDVVVGTSALQHDFDCAALQCPPGTIPYLNVRDFPLSAGLRARIVAAMNREGARCHEGVIATGDQFIDSAAARARIQDAFHALATEMEGGAIAQACYLAKIPCAILRAISDNADGDAQMSFAEFSRKAADQTVRGLMRFLAGSGDER